MSTLETVPELADGGYWYVVEAVPDPDMGGSTPGVVPGIGWCAWYAGSQVVIRTPEPVTGLVAVDGVTAVEVLTAAGYTGKPYGRIGGN